MLSAARSLRPQERIRIRDTINSYRLRGRHKATSLSFGDAVMLYECHAHIMLDGVSQKDAQSRHANGPDESWVRAKLEEYKTADVRYIRDGGDKFGIAERTDR